LKVEVEAVSFAYGRAQVLSAVCLELPEGGITALIGPSGAGKSSLLRLMAGLLRPARGRILYDGEDMAAVRSDRRDVGVVLPPYPLAPHLSVRDNIASGLKAGRRRFSLRSSRRRPSRHSIEARVWDTAALLGLERLLDRKPAQLSGGERQRVALARAVAPRPGLLLLDEPLAALDARLRRDVRTELAAFLRKLGTTVLYSTHDQEEAMLLADHLVVLDQGRVAAAGPSLDLYRRPATPFLASFLGEANLIEVAVAAGATAAGCKSVDTALGRLPLPAGAARGWLLVRPEELAEDPRGAVATVLDARGLGTRDRVLLALDDGTELLAHFPPDSAPAPGSKIRIGVRSPRPHFLADAGDPIL
jgi:ABC-type sugar transport system ATPase subunit